MVNKIDQWDDHCILSGQQKS